MQTEVEHEYLKKKKMGYHITFFRLEEIYRDILFTKATRSL